MKEIDKLKLQLENYSKENIRLQEELKELRIDYSMVVSENKLYKGRINKTIDYIKNEMPYLEEPDDDYENNHKMQEYDESILLKMLKGEDINE